MLIVAPALINIEAVQASAHTHAHTQLHARTHTQAEALTLINSKAVQAAAVKLGYELDRPKVCALCVSAYMHL